MVQALAQEMEWIARILSGERDLFHELIRPYERVVFLTAVSVLRDSTEAEDAAQEAMIKAYRGLASFRGDAKFSTWLTTITLNEARSRLRKSGRVKVESLDDTGAGGGLHALPGGRLARDTQRDAGTRGACATYPERDRGIAAELS